jgi:ATP-dependent helicase/nuclease subunit A
MMNGRAVVTKHKASQQPLLKGAQRQASRHDAQVQLSASAGTGKTQVLSARVLRLLLNGVAPDSILCLTFTKAGAAEMKERIHKRLGLWVTMDGPLLARELENLGEDIGQEGREEARTLFAQMLDARGSGLRIQTIHSFCQTLLASFPAEAGLPVGFKAVEGRELDLLGKQALSKLVEEMDRSPDEVPRSRFKRLVRHLGEKALRSYLARCGSAAEAFETLPIGDVLSEMIQSNLADGVSDIAGWLAKRCDNDVLPRHDLDYIIEANAAWKTATGEKNIAKIQAWLAASIDEKIAGLEAFRRIWATANDVLTTKAPKGDAYVLAGESMIHWCDVMIDMKRTLGLTHLYVDALEVGRTYAAALSAIKNSAAVVDFNDLIKSTVRLLKMPGIGEWIRFKLDQSIDHILVDEAQDTNADQWDIIRSLTDEFFAGDGQKPDKVRTVFKVGDFKQAIFGFQGTDPRQFSAATEAFKRDVENSGQTYLQLSLNQSFRSSQPILDVTDAVIECLGREAFGVTETLKSHVSAKGGSGSIHLLAPISDDVGDDDQGGDSDQDTHPDPDDAPGITKADMKWATALAKRVSGWTRGPNRLRLRNQGRDAEPGDVMILLRSRKDLARLIVSRLYQEQVPVAGIDRLQLGAPIAVQDLLSCARFALQPHDDLTLACLLVSPIVGWTQDQLYEAAKGERVGSLWEHLRNKRPSELRFIQSLADRGTPYQFFEAILSDPNVQGRKRLIARLGEETRDPINELLNASLSFAQDHVPSLQLFLNWFATGDSEVKRDAGKAENAVRVMTVHGAKGLQAPIVVLADATFDPKPKSKSDVTITLSSDDFPVFRPSKGNVPSTFKKRLDDQDARDLQEHWRLLYVAMTRAEEHLFAGGALTGRQIGKPLHDGIWFEQLSRAALKCGGVTTDTGDIIWQAQEAERGYHNPHEEAERWAGELPNWITNAAAPEARPPKPLAPSAIGHGDDEISPPPNPKMRDAARRGILLHSLFERLPAVAVDNRRGAALRWLEHSAGVAEEAVRTEIADVALRMLNTPEFEDIFSPQSLPEVSLSGIVDGAVVTGVMDRLVVTDREVMVVDFKTGRFVPHAPEAIPSYHLAQMAAYAALLGSIFPGRAVRAALLYSHGPKLIELMPDQIEAYKPGYQAKQQVLAEAS